jgi:hypothetical protein
MTSSSYSSGFEPRRPRYILLVGQSNHVSCGLNQLAWYPKVPSEPAWRVVLADSVKRLVFFGYLPTRPTDYELTYLVLASCKIRGRDALEGEQIVTPKTFETEYPLASMALTAQGLTAKVAANGGHAGIRFAKAADDAFFFYADSLVDEGLPNIRLDEGWVSANLDPLIAVPASSHKLQQILTLNFMRRHCVFHRLTHDTAEFTELLQCETQRLKQQFYEDQF